MLQLLLTVLAAVSSVSAGVLYNPLSDVGKTDASSLFKKDGPTDTFLGHFDQHRVGTDHYLQTHLSALYPNKTLTSTQDYRFQLLAYAANEPTGKKIMVRQMKDVEAIKRTVYMPSLRRRDGDGRVYDALVFAGYDIAWGDEEFVAFVATWSEGYSTITQWFIFGDNESAAHQLIHDCAAFTSTVRDAVWVFDQSSWRPDYALWQSIQSASWDDVVLEDKLKKSIQNDYRSFFKSEDVYKHLQVPWKRGLIFLGPPGNGKTISLKAIMKEVKLPLLYVKSFHTYAGDEYGIREVFRHARAFAPCVLILEDLDSLITDQNRAFFLNEVDGLEDNDGLLLIGSTNHFDRLDPALSSRPSRFDRKYNFPNPNKEERTAYAKYWQDKLSDKPDLKFPDELVDSFAGKTNKFSFAYMKEAFISTLLIIAGQEPEDEVDFGKILLEQVQKLREQIDEGEEMMSWGVPFSSESGYSSSGGDEGGEWRGDDAGNDRWDGQADESSTASGPRIPAGQTVFGMMA